MNTRDQKEEQKGIIVARVIVILILAVITFLLAGAGRVMLRGTEQETSPSSPYGETSPPSGFREPAGPPSIQEPPGPPPNY